jgi:hypothetical protein
MGVPSDIKINDSAWKAASKESGAEIQEWHDQEGVDLVIHCIGFDESLYNKLSNLNDTRKYYRDIFAKQGIGIIQCDITEIDGLICVKTIGKKIDEDRPALYIGSIAIPLPNESFVLSLYAQELGTTGVRETTVHLKLMHEGYTFEPDENTGEMSGWARDPYFPDFDGPSLANLADSEEYDLFFPEHPLSKIRKRIISLIDTVRISEDVKNR